MALPVKALVQYLTAAVEHMRDEDYVGLQITKAVKGREPGGRRRSFTFAQKAYSFGPGDAAGAVEFWTDWVSEMIRPHIAQLGSDVCLVPVPNSGAIAGQADSFRTLELAQHIALKCGAGVAAKDELRWTEPLVPANQGGTRSPITLYSKLSFTMRGNQTASRILIDDVLTSGGHLRACAARLRENNCPATAAIVCGRTEQEQIAEPYDVPVVELPDYDPNDPYGIGELAKYLDPEG